MIRHALCLSSSHRVRRGSRIQRSHPSRISSSRLRKTFSGNRYAEMRQPSALLNAGSDLDELTLRAALVGEYEYLQDGLEAAALFRLRDAPR